MSTFRNRIAARRARVLTTIIAALVVAMACLTPVVIPGIIMAQTTSDQATEISSPVSAPESGVEPPQIRLRPLLATDVPLNEPVAVDLGALSVSGVAPSLTAGVTVKAYTRHVEFEGSRVGQLVLTGVEKNGAREHLPSGLFNAQFDLDEPRLEAGREVVVEGDSAPLVAALEKLAAAGEESEPEEKPARRDRDNGNDRPTGGQNGGDGTGNDLAGNYRAPESVRATPVAKESTEGVNVTTEGCTIRVDIAKMQAYQQSRTETVKDGVVQSRSECTDDLGNAFPLQKSYGGCTEAIDLDAATATARYLLYYMDAGLARQEVSECREDSDKVFPIVEKPEGCSIFLDYAALKAVPQAALSYINDSNAEVQVRGCAASTVRSAVPMTPSVDGCTVRHDFAAGKSYQQGTHVYELDGTRYQAGGCTDSETVYAHEKVYDDASGRALCTPLVDPGGNSATLQSRIRITVGGAGRYITDCAPDTSGIALTATTEGCDNPHSWQHDLAAGQSYGRERFYYTRGAVRNYVTECRRSRTVYAHQVETTGWQHHDDERFAYALNTVYITPPTGRYNVVTSEVLQGTAQMPYVLTGTEVRETGTVTYEGCSKFVDTATMELWKRPDDSVHEKPVGPGERRGPLEACISVATRNWPKISDSIDRDRCMYTRRIGRLETSTFVPHPGWRQVRRGTYRGTWTVTREDGEVIRSQTAEKYLGSSTGCGEHGYGTPAALPNRASVGQSTEWSIELGWVNN